MMEENIKLIIEGYNAEKLILSEKLSQLPPTDNYHSLSGSIEDRLDKIDKQIGLLIKD